MTYQARPGDVYLLCSDGLTTMLREDRIAAALASSDSLDDGRVEPRPRGERSRRPRQHHGGRLPAGGGRGGGRGQGAADLDRPGRRGGRADRGCAGRGSRRRRGGPTRGAHRARARRPGRRPRRWPRRLARSLAGVAIVAVIAGGGRLRAAPGLLPRHATPAAGWRSIAAFRTTCRWGSSSTRRSTPPRSRSPRSPRTGRTAPPITHCAPAADAVSLIDDLQVAAEPPVHKPKRGHQAKKAAPGGWWAAGRGEEERVGCAAPAAEEGSERAQPRAPGAPPRRPAGHRWVHGGVHRRVEPDRGPQPDLRRLLPRRLPRASTCSFEPACPTQTRTCSRSARCSPRSAW